MSDWFASENLLDTEERHKEYFQKYTLFQKIYIFIKQLDTVEKRLDDKKKHKFLNKEVTP